MGEMKEVTAEDLKNHLKMHGSFVAGKGIALLMRTDSTLIVKLIKDEKDQGVVVHFFQAFLQALGEVPRLMGERMAFLRDAFSKPSDIRTFKEKLDQLEAGRFNFKVQHLLTHRILDKGF